MPVQACSTNGKPGYQYGDSGTCYTYEDGNESGRKSAKQKAYVQGYAIQKSQARQQQTESEQSDARKAQARAKAQVDAHRTIKRVEERRGHDLSERELTSLLGALGDVVRCKVGDKLGVKYPGGTCFTYNDKDPDSESEARARAAQQGEKIRQEKSRRLGQPGVRGVHSSKPLKRARSVGDQGRDVEDDPAEEKNRLGDTDGTGGQSYSKSEVDYGPGKGEQECGNCRFFTDGSCSLVKGRIDPEAWCQLFSPTDVQDLERDDEDDKTAKRLTESDLTRFYELKDVKLDDVQGARRSWVPIFPEGTFSHPEYGTLDFTDGELRKYVLNFRQRVRKIDIAVDIDHKNEDAVGWLKDVDLRPGIGLFGLVEWNQHGAGLIADKRYRYISPQFGEYVDEESGRTYDPVLVALTITNFPFLKSMAAVSLRKKEGRGPTVIGRDKMATTSTRLKKAMGVPDSKDMDDEEAKRADDEEADDSEGDTAKRAKKAKKAKRADDEEMMDGDSDDAMKSSELDDTDDETASRLYDDEDVYDDESADQFEKSSKQDVRPITKGKPGAYDAPVGGKSSSERNPEVRRLLAESARKDRRLAALEAEMLETRRTLRLGAVREQIRKLSDPRGAKKLSFTKPVMEEFRKLALSNKPAGDALFRILSLIQKDGLVSLSIDGRASDPDDDRDDPTGRGAKVLRDKKTGKPIIGANDQRRAMMYASEHKLDWNNLEDRMTAYLHTSDSVDVDRDDDDGYTREV